MKKMISAANPDAYVEALDGWRRKTRFEAFDATAEEFDRHQAIRGVAARLMEALRGAWTDAAPVPLYPAFEGGRNMRSKQE